MKKENIYKLLYAISIFLIVIFFIRLGMDYYNYYNFNNSAPFYVHILERGLEFIIPSIIVFLVGFFYKRYKNNKNNKIILIVVISIVVLLLGSTLAYLLITNKGKENEFITMDNIDIEYVEGSSIRNNDLQLPMNEDEVLKYAPKHEFSVRNNNNKEVYLSFKLTNLNIDKEIYSDGNLRYSLYHNNEKIGVGSFEAYDEKTKELILLTNIKQDASAEESYQLYIWIRDNGGNQNHFLNMNLNGKIKVEGYDKELPTLASAILGKNNKNVITDTPDFSKASVSQEYYDTLPETSSDSTVLSKSKAMVETGGLYKDTDSDGDTYYYRGYVENNYISFAGILWRILRINGDGTIRIITDDKIGESKYNEDKTIEKYEGYTYDNSAPNVQDGTSSTIKKYLEDWYNDNLIKYDKYISTSEFCCDTTIANQHDWPKIYSSFDKLTNGNSTYICPKTDKTYGGKYYLKIALPNIDDMKHIGMIRGIQNYLSTYHFYKYSSMTMSPSGYNGYNNVYYTLVSIARLTLSEYGNLDDIMPVFPIINLNQNNIIIKGNGTKDDPYILK